MPTASSCHFKQLAGLTAASLGALAGQNVLTAAPISEGIPANHRNEFPQSHFLFTQEGVLGTSLELLVEAAQPADAMHCQQTVFGEIERLRQILSTYDPASEINRVRAGGEVVSTDLAQVLALYEKWAQRTDGAISAHLAGVVQVWKDGAKSGQLPSTAALRAASRAISTLNVDALGKSYIIDRAVEVARRLVPSGLLNIGGDIRAWGASAWLIGVADPRHPEENAPLLAQFYLRDAAVATSGGYARYFTIAGQKFSHLINPRTLQPTAPHASATVVAADCITANALATASCVLDVLQAGRLLVTESFGHLIVDAAGRIFRGGILTATAPTPPLDTSFIPAPKSAVPPTPAPASPAPTASNTTAATPPAAETPWPKDFQVIINVALGVGSTTSGQPNANGFAPSPRGMKRPYLAIWIEDAKLKTVRSLAVLGSNPNYQHELTNWFKASGNPTILRAITRATRPAGQYQFVWDGLDDQGKPLPQGDYVVFVEINREHGTHVQSFAKIVCGEAPATVPLKATTESDASTVVYGQKEMPAAPATIALSGNTTNAAPGPTSTAPTK
jgi:thiamine biosynthesis lipoprotein ApbE